MDQNGYLSPVFQIDDKSMEIFSINKLTSHKLDPEIVGRNNLVLTSVTTSDYKSHPFQILLDTGASYSVIDLEFFNQLLSFGLEATVQRSSRKKPSSASNHEFDVHGDVVLDLQFKSTDGDLQVNNIRFTILQSLSAKMIIGIEALVALDLKLGEFTVSLLNRRIPICDTTRYAKMEVIDAVTPYDSEAVVAYLRIAEDTTWIDSKKFYVINPIFPEDGTSASRSRKDPINSDLCLLKRSELKAPFQYQLYSPIFELPKLLACRVEEVDDKHKWKTNKKCRINSLQERAELINPEILEKIANDSEFGLETKSKLAKLLVNYRDVFSASEYDVGEYTNEKVELELINPDPVYIKPRRVPYKLREVLTDSVKEMCKQGIIEETKKGSAYNSPVHLVRKAKTNKWRFCVDFRQLNKRIKQNRYPLPRIQDLLEQLKDATFLSSFDLKQGFFNIALQKSSRELTAFSVDGRQFHFLKLPMGLSTSPQIFQRIMQEILYDDLGKGVIVYLDDVLLFSKTEVEHLALIKNLLEKLGRAGILLNAQKCKLGRLKLDYLGFTISKDGYTAQKGKTDAIRDFPKPTTKTELKRFLGMASFYSTVVPALQYVMGDLHEITGSKTHFDWTAKQEAAFNRVKELLVNSATLAFPSNNPNSKLILSTDASKEGWGAALTERGPDGLERPIGFTSGRFRDAAMNWIIAEKEAAAFVNALNYFYVYLYGSDFIFRTDNKSLSFIDSTSFTKKTSGAPNMKTLRWLEFISQFTFSVEHHSGESPCMKVPDCLSRQFDNTVMAINQLAEVIIQEPFWVKHSICMADFQTAQLNDQALQEKSGRWTSFTKHGWIPELKNGLIYFKRKNGILTLAIPEAIQKDLLDFVHYPHHLSQKPMIEAIRKNYCIPNLTREVSLYISECIHCLAVKQKVKAKTPSIPSSQPQHPWESLQVDLIGPLTVSLEKNVYIVSVIDTFTRWCELRAIKNRKAASVAEALLDVFYCRGPPLNVTMDNAKELKSDLMQNLLASMGIYSQKICPYRPQSNGMVESLNKRVKTKLQLWQVDPLYWDKSLKAIQLALNLEKLSELKTSPFELLHGWLLEPTHFVDNGEKDKLKSTINMSEWLKTNRILMAHALTNHYKLDKSIRLRRTNNQKDQTSILKPGDLVLRYVIQPPMECAKLYRSWKGIYIILEKLDINTYIVAREDDKRKKFIVHRDRLRLIGLPDVKTSTGSAMLRKHEEIQKAPENKNNEDCQQEVDINRDQIRRSERLKKKVSNYKHFFEE